jgi:hypothetical protein
MMIDQVDQDLRDWVTSTLTGIDVSLDVPTAKAKGPTVVLYLFELTQTPPPRSTKRPPLQLTLRYLVTVQEARTEVGHQLLGELMLAAMQNPRFEVEAEPIPLAFWAALTIAPKPSFVLRVPLRIDRDQPQAPLVRTPIVVNSAPLSPLDGLVLGPGDIPLSGAMVELPDLQRFTQTDFKGRFHFAAVRSDPRGVLMRVRAKGFEMTVTPGEQERRDHGPVVIRFDRMEG